MKTGRGIASPFVEVEVVGADYDSISKYKTGTKGTVRRTYSHIADLVIIFL